MSQPPLNALRAFEAVARLNSFSAAAGALFVTQSAVSHQIRHLEDWLGAPLFDRSAGRPKLLPRGAELARRLSLSFAEIDAACSEARQTGQPSALVIAAIPSVAICWLIPRLEGFRAAHPDIPLRVIYAFHGHEIDFSSTHFAFVFAARPPNLPGVRAHRFLPGTSAPVCSPSLLPGFADPHPGPDEICGAGLLHDTDTTAWRDWLTRAKGRAGHASSGPIFEDFNLLRAAALAGQGVALCPLSMIRDDLDQGRLVQLSNVTVLDSYAYYLLTPETIPEGQAEAVQSFLTWVLSQSDGAELRVTPAPSAPGSDRQRR